MAFTNNMSLLIDKIEIRLGTSPLNLPDKLQKDQWARKVIAKLTIPTFSRYFPFKVPYTVHQTDKDRTGQYYLIDEKRISPEEDIRILGVRDIKWDEMTPDSAGINNQPWGQYDVYPNDYSLDDFMILQNRASQLSLFNNGLFIDFIPPNRVAVRNAAGTNMVVNLDRFKIEVFIEQPKSLLNISPTKMETFEKLAQADVASFLYGELKYYDDLETVFGNSNMKLETLQEEANKRDEAVAVLEDGYVNAGNDDQPIMYTI